MEKLTKTAKAAAWEAARLNLAKQQMNIALYLDLLLLEMEAEMGMMDGIKLEQGVAANAD